MITKKTKIFSILSLLTMGFASGALIFEASFIHKKGTELTQQAKAVADYSAREQTYRNLEDLVEKTKMQREELAGYILTEEGTIQFLSDIEADAKKLDIELTTNSLKVEEGKKLFDTLHISFEVQGSKEKVYKFIEIFESLPYHTEISKIDIYTKTDKQGEVVQGTIELSASLLKT